VPTTEEILQRLKKSGNSYKCRNCGSDEYIEGSLIGAHSSDWALFTPTDSVRESEDSCMLVNKPSFWTKIRACAKCGAFDLYVDWKKPH